MSTSSKALLIIDMINDFQFQHGPILAEKASVITENILALKNYCHESNIPVIYINDHYSLWKADLHSIIEHCSNKYSHTILEKLAPQKTDYFLIKPKHSAFYGTALNTLLHQLKVDELILTGIAGNICVLFTANDAYMREYSLIVPENAIASVDEQDNIYALTMMKNVMKAKIFTYEKNSIMSSPLYT